MRTQVGLHLNRCVLQGPIFAHNAWVPWLELFDCRIPFFHADRIRVDGTLYLRGLGTTSNTADSAVRLVGARIGRNLELDGACLDNPEGPALHAEGIHVGRALRFRHARATVSCDTGAVQLVNARVRGDLWLDGTTLTNGHGPVLNAEGLHVGGSLLLCSGFEAVAKSKELATIHLMSARVGSRLDLGVGRRFTGKSFGSEPEDPEDPEKRARRPAKIVNTDPSAVTLDLRCATVNELRIPPETVCRPVNGRCTSTSTVVLAELEYGRLSRESAHPYWPHWFSVHARPFEAQPYQHLAAVLRNTGRATEAREVLIALEDERHQTNESATRGSRIWHWVKKRFIGHGYRPGRALVGLAGVFVVALALTWAASSADVVHRSVPRVQNVSSAVVVEDLPDTDFPCRFADTIRLAADLSVPLISTGGRSRCDFKADGGWAMAATIAGLLLQILGWAFATLFVVGFTGVVRRF
ncbi:hypothetical protein [Umezawaea sp.]|uniref:hypothetical protein n=1 Tax=Umezawaea sp. TaxID=1955258 RepID=UPI002ED6258D